jgi:acetoacetyl-CoA synthetase
VRDNPEILWRPPGTARRDTRIGQFMSWLHDQRGSDFTGYHDLWDWSVTDLEGFWSAVWEYFDVRASVPYTQVLTDDTMPNTRWFTGARLNYAEHCCLGGDGPDTALIGISQTRGASALTFAELRDEVARVRTGLRELGLRQGDTLAAYLPNIPEAVVLFLAAASLGVLFVSGSPELGVHSVVDRFAQLEPKVLVVCDGYRHRDRRITRSAEVEEILRRLPSVTATVMIPHLDVAHEHPYVSCDRLRAETAPLEFEHLDFDHPLYVLFSSGTTGAPKGFVHAHGPILVEHLKTAGLQRDLGPRDTVLQPATTSWMVWNFNVSVLAVGATLVCFDGDPTWPDPLYIWRTAAETGATSVAVGAALLLDAAKTGLRPAEEVDLSRLRFLTSTGSPLGLEGFRWVYDAFDPSTFLSSGSGGTEICTGLVGGVLVLPVTAGEMACRYLGASVESYDTQGRPVRNEPGELVITRPMPTMPRGLIGDPDGERYAAAYFRRFPGVWTHGDWLTITDRATCVIGGRSDATLNRGGVRIGTSEIYAIVDSFAEVGDSVIVHLEDPDGGAGDLVLIVAASPDEELEAGLRDAIRTQLSARHVPDAIRFVPTLPRTLTGKKLEMPIKRILLGAEPDTVVSRGAVTEPLALDAIRSLALELGASR